MRGRFRSKTLLVLVFAGVIILLLCFYNQNIIEVHTEHKVSQQVTRWFENLNLWKDTDNGCQFENSGSVSNSIDTGELYPDLDFRVPDNRGIGFWSEVLESQYREIRNTWKDLPLKVIVVPHSHIDPGWLRTYDDYYHSMVANVLDNMVNFMNKKEDFKFIWSEVTYLAKWWNKQTEGTQDNIRKLLYSKQLEIVTGGWVMPDEATASYYSIIDQLVEGQQWLKHYVNYTPSHAWSVDVFGHSAAMPRILAGAGISAMTILRIHYAWKSYISKNRWFDFNWEPVPGLDKIFCHMAPSDLYSFKHACGPDPQACLKYDFRRLSGEYSESTADEITDNNVEEKALLLLSQYGRFASLFKHNVLLVPLGDDFRYNIYLEWEQQYKNYRKLFDYINNREDWNAHVLFGTLDDYLKEVNGRLHRNGNETLQTLKGDFFPYADTYANAIPSYWTGFYSTRPFYKSLSRELEHWLRTTEILYSLAKTKVSSETNEKFREDYKSLISVRQALALFQHHDAITGTSKQNVMEDYGRKLHIAILDAMTITSHISQMLLMKQNVEGNTWTSQLYPDAYRSSWNEPTKKLIALIPENGRKVVLFNSLTVERKEVVRLKVRTTSIEVFSSDGKKVPSQLNPVWENSFTVSKSLFELIFLATVKPLSYATYMLRIAPNENSKAVISLFLNDDDPTKSTLKSSAFKFENGIRDEINLESPYIRAKFSASGILKEIYTKGDGISKSVSIDFSSYFPVGYRSGAYLFKPETQNPVPVTNLTDHFPMLVLVRGPLVSEVTVIYHKFLKYSVRLYKFRQAPKGIEIKVTSDLSKLNKDIELVMRVRSDVNNQAVFHTDSNGLLMLKRRYAPKIPIEGNYYPATSCIYIEDESCRMSLALPYTQGVTSPTSGTLEVMIDRRMRNDDGRGMGEGVMDNRLITPSFWLTLESPRAETSLSPVTRIMSLRSQFPLVILLADNVEIIKPQLSFLSHPWPSTVHLVNLRTISSTQNYNSSSPVSLMILEETNDKCGRTSFIDNAIKEQNKFAFSETEIDSIVKTSLTGTIEQNNGDDVVNSTIFSNLQACKITFK